MNAIQKAFTAAIALTITLVGGTLATAPLALADVQLVAAHHAAPAAHAASHGGLVARAATTCPVEI